MALSFLDNVDYRGKKPNFARDLFETIEEMVTFSENYLPDMFIASNKETGKQYVYNRENEPDDILGKWRLIDEEAVKKIEIDNCGVKDVESILLVDGEFTTAEGTEQEYPYYKITRSSGELLQNTRLNKATLYEIVVDDVTYKFVGEECFRLDGGSFSKGEFIGNSTMVNSAYYTAKTTNEDLDWILIADTSKSVYLYIMTKEPRTVKLKVSQYTRTVVPFFNDLIFGSLFSPFNIEADGSAFSKVSIAGANKIDTAHRGILAIGDCNVFNSGSSFNTCVGYGNENKAPGYNFTFGMNNKIKDSSQNTNYIIGAGNSVGSGWSTLAGSYCTLGDGVICSSILGYEAECNANLSIAIGVDSKVGEGADSSTAIGKYVKTTQKGQVALGFGNKGAEKNLFEIGNGKDTAGNYIYGANFPKESNITRDNAFEVTYDGIATAKTGIGIDDVTLTKEELTALKNLSTEDIEYPVTSVNGQTGDVEIDINSIGAVSNEEFSTTNAKVLSMETTVGTLQEQVENNTDELADVLALAQGNSEGITTLSGQINTISELANTANTNATEALTKAQNAENTVSIQQSTVTNLSNQVGDMVTTVEGHTASINTLQSSIGGKANSADVYTKDQVDSKVSSSVSSVYKYKGNVATLSALDDIESPENGHVYFVTEDSLNYAYTDGSWNPLAGIIDLSDYVTDSDMTTALASKANTTDIKTKTSQLENDSEFVTQTDVEAMLSSAGVGAVQTVNGKYGNVELNAADVGAVTAGEVTTIVNTALGNYYTKTEVDGILGDIASILDEINGEIV